MRARLQDLKEQCIRNHLRALEISSRLTQIWRDMCRPAAVRVSPEGVLRVLKEVSVRPVLIGTHALVGWRSEPRATQDVDVLVRKKDVRRAVTILQQTYPELQVQETSFVARFVDPVVNHGVIDVHKPKRDFDRQVFRNTIPVDEAYDIPQLESVLASKFGVMMSAEREPDKKMLDAGDFMDVVHHNRAAIDFTKLRRLAETLGENAEPRMMQMIADTDAGRTIRF